MGMDIYVGARGSGKTATLIKKSAETGAYILVATKFRAHTVYKQAKEMEYDIPFPLTVSEITTGQKYFFNSYMKDHSLLIDELEAVLDVAFCGIPIHGATMSDTANIKMLFPRQGQAVKVYDSEQE